MDKNELIDYYHDMLKLSLIDFSRYMFNGGFLSVE